MPRIGTVIREVYRRPGAELLPGHLEERYGIRVTATTRLDGGVAKVEHDGGPPWVARIYLSSRPAARTEADYEGHPGQDLAAAAALLADLDGRVPPQYRQVYEALQELLPLGDGARGLPETFIH